MSRAVCVRCGASRADFRQICPACGHRPVDDGLLVAWLLSGEHLSDDQLQVVAERIRDGEAIRPSDAQLSQARRALGRAFSTDPGLTGLQRAGLLASSLLLTPLPGWFCFVWWFNTRPRAAWQSLALAVPGSLLYFVFGLYLALWPTIETVLQRAQ